MLTLETACTALGVALGDVLAHRIYPDRVVLVVKDGRKLTYTDSGTDDTEKPGEATEVATAVEPERAPGKRKARGISTDIKNTDSENVRIEEGEEHA